MTIKDYLRKRVWPSEILGEVEQFPYVEEGGQIHLFKVAWRALVAVTPSGPLVIMEWVGQEN